MSDVMDTAAAEQPVRGIMKDQPAVEQHDSLRDAAMELAPGMSSRRIRFEVAEKRSVRAMRTWTWLRARRPVPGGAG